MGFLEALGAGESWIGMHLVQPLIILLLGVFLAKIVEQALLFMFESLSLRTYATTFSAYVVKWALYVLTLLYALSSIHLLTPVLRIAVIVICLVLALSALLGLRDFLTNVIHHHSVKTKHKVGAKVKVKSCEGTIVAVHLSDTQIRTKEGDDVYIPNSALVK